ncbi:hypothetical protein CKQ90_35510, partial [Klebsiella pneumoniae]
FAAAAALEQRRPERLLSSLPAQCSGGCTLGGIAADIRDVTSFAAAAALEQRRPERLLSSLPAQCSGGCTLGGI